MYPYKKGLKMTARKKKKNPVGRPKGFSPTGGVRTYPNPKTVTLTDRQLVAFNLIGIAAIRHWLDLEFERLKKEEKFDLLSL